MLTDNTATLVPLEDFSLADKAYMALHDAILHLKLEPGEPLVEQKLAAALGISKTPIRQALHRLEQTGLIKATPGKGYAVAPLTLRDAREILEIRSALEGLAAELACARLSDDQLTSLGDLLTVSEDAYAAGNVELAVDLGHQFHQVLIESTDNDRLISSIGVLSGQYRRVRLLSNQNVSRAPRSLEEHREVFLALSRRNPEAAASAMRTHLLAVYEDLREGDFLPRDPGPGSR